MLSVCNGCLVVQLRTGRPDERVGSVLNVRGSEYHLTHGREVIVRQGRGTRYDDADLGPCLVCESEDLAAIHERPSLNDKNTPAPARR